MTSAGALDLPPLRRSLVRCGLSVAIAAATVAYVQGASKRAEALEEREAARRTALLAARHAGAGPAEAASQTWRERIEQIRVERGLPDLRLDFPAAAAAGIGAPGTAAGEAVLHLGLLHEEDLLAVLDDLAKVPGALFRVRACTVERAADDDRPASLLAECRVTGFLREPA